MQPGSARAQFWQWFKNNGDRLRAIMYAEDEAAREDASDKLRAAIEVVEPGLVLEFGQNREGEPHQLIVSADGKPERVDAVKEFVASALALPGWNVVAFRPRMEIGESIEIVLQGERVGPEDIWFRVTEEDGGLDLTLRVRGLTSANERMRSLGATLLAEHAVGERDALTLLSSLHVEPLPNAPASSGLHPFRELVGVFDKAKAKKYPPPGMLSINSDSDWQSMRGTIDNASALVLLHAGLRPLVGHPDYERRLIVTVPFNQTRDDGMPATEEEYQAVCNLGDQFSEALQEGQESLLAMTLVTQGRRDLIFYTSNPENALHRLEALRAEAHTRRVESRNERDTFWAMYRSFCQAAVQIETEE